MTKDVKKKLIFLADKIWQIEQNHTAEFDFRSDQKPTLDRVILLEQYLDKLKETKV